MQNFEDSEPIAAINVTPLVDVCLVMVIIFMTAAPLSMQAGIGLKMLKKEVEATAPTKGGAPAVRAEVMVRLEVGRILVNDQLIEPEKLPYVLTELLNQNEQKMVYIYPQDEVKHGKIVEVMDLSRQCGALRLSIVQEAALPEPVIKPKANPPQKTTRRRRH